MATIGYIRVSTIDQDEHIFENEILRFANEKKITPVEFIHEKVSGKISWKKRKLGTIINNLKKGDNLIVSELSRLGRSMLECMEILNICMQKEVNIYAIKGEWQLNDSLQSKMLAMCFLMAAEIERDLISRRTKEALRVKKENGCKLGRPKGPGKSKLDQYREEIIALLNNGSTKRFVARRYKTSESNLFNWLKKNKIEIKIS